MIKRWIVLMAVVLTTGCSDSGGDKLKDRCTQISRAICGTLARCHGQISSITVTPALCTQLESQFVEECLMGDVDGLKDANDQAVATCVSDYETYACSNICDQVPQDPASCQALNPAPNDITVTCAE